MHLKKDNAWRAKRRWRGENIYIKNTAVTHRHVMLRQKYVACPALAIDTTEGVKKTPQCQCQQYIFGIGVCLLGPLHGGLWVHRRGADSRCPDYCPHSGGSDSYAVIQLIQQWCQRPKLLLEPSVEAMEYLKWPEPVLPGEWGKNPTKTEELSVCSSPWKVKHLHAKIKNISLQEKEGLNSWGTKNKWGENIHGTGHSVSKLHFNSHLLTCTQRRYQ